MGSTLALLTASRLHTARACRRLHRLQYVLGYRAVGDVPTLRFGSLVHRGLEAWWRAAQAKFPRDMWLTIALEAIKVEADEFDRARAAVLLAGYHCRWADEPYEVLAVEVRFRTPLRNPETGRPSRHWELAGKLDVLVRDRRDGLVYLVEHKTSSEDVGPGSNYIKRLRLDGQISAYYEGASSLGYEVAGCVYDALGKPLQRPHEVPVLDEEGLKIVVDASGQRIQTQQGKWRQTPDGAAGYILRTRPETADEFQVRLGEVVAADPNRYFQRATVVRLDGEMREALADIWALAQELTEAERHERAPRNPDACVRYGRTCQFFAVCTGEASLDDERFFERVADVHPELAEEAL